MERVHFRSSAHVAFGCAPKNRNTSEPACFSFSLEPQSRSLNPIQTWSTLPMFGHTETSRFGGLPLLRHTHTHKHAALSIRSPFKFRSLYFANCHPLPSSMKSTYGTLFGVEYQRGTGAVRLIYCSLVASTIALIRIICYSRKPINLLDICLVTVCFWFVLASFLLVSFWLPLQLWQPFLSHGCTRIPSLPQHGSVQNPIQMLVPKGTEIHQAMLVVGRFASGDLALGFAIVHHHASLLRPASSNVLFRHWAPQMKIPLKSNIIYSRCFRFQHGSRFFV